MGREPSGPRPHISSGQGFGLGGIQQSPKALHWDYSQPGARTGIWLLLMAPEGCCPRGTQTQAELLLPSFLLPPHVTSDQAPATLERKEVSNTQTVVGSCAAHGKMHTRFSMGEINCGVCRTLGTVVH